MTETPTGSGVEPNEEPAAERPRAKTPLWVWILGILIAFAAVTMMWEMTVPMYLSGMGAETHTGGPGGGNH